MNEVTNMKWNESEICRESFIKTRWKEKKMITELEQKKKLQKP